MTPSISIHIHVHEPVVVSNASCSMPQPTPAKAGRKSAFAPACDFLRDVLQDSPRAVHEVFEVARGTAFFHSQLLEIAAQKLGVRKYCENGRLMWSLPETYVQAAAEGQSSQPQSGGDISDVNTHSTEPVAAAP